MLKKSLGVGVLWVPIMLLIAMTAAHAEPARTQNQSPSLPPTKSDFQPPKEDELGTDEFSKVVRAGEEVFTNTQALHGKYVGNGLNCVNCHLDRGRLADSAPMWGAYVLYPAFRKKSNSVSSLTERIQGCFTYSMNGAPPPADSDVIKNLETYFFWLAKTAPVGVKLKGSGYAKLPNPTQKPDITRGNQVFNANCAVCHGVSGQGTKQGTHYAFPPLWGKDSYNWGAGMHTLDNAAAFIKANMPLGKPKSLTDQEAWDVAAFVNSHERPQDPRSSGDIKATKAKYHDENCLYGTNVQGALLGAHADANPLKKKR